MNRFIRLISGEFLNIDHYVNITLPTKKDDDHVRFECSDGSAISVRVDDIPGLEKALMPVIPAAANTWAVVMWSDGDRDGGVSEQPIIGWRDYNGYAEPILNQDGNDNNDFVFLKTPTGKFLELSYDGSLFPSLATAVQYVRDTMKRRNGVNKQ